MDDDTRYAIQAMLDELWTAAVERERDCPHEHAQARAQAQIAATGDTLTRVMEIVSDRQERVLYAVAHDYQTANDQSVETTLEDVADRLGIGEGFGL